MNGIGEEHDAGDEGGHGDRDPDLLGAALDRLDELALHVAPDGARLLGDEPAEVAGLAVEGEHGDQAVERVDVGDGCPLAQRVDLGEPLADAAAHAGRSWAHAPEPRAASRLSAAPSE